LWVLILAQFSELEKKKVFSTRCHLHAFIRTSCKLAIHKPAWERGKLSSGLTSLPVWPNLIPSLA